MLYFLSGLPRSGSTVLAALLNQRPDIHVTPTSGLIDIFGAVCQTWENNPSTKAQKQTTEHLYATLRALVPKREDGKIVVDKSRGWVTPVIQKTMEGVLKAPPKIVATVRNTDACAASFVKIAKPENVAEFLANSDIVRPNILDHIWVSGGIDNLRKHSSVNIPGCNVVGDFHVPTE